MFHTSFFQSSCSVESIYIYVHVPRCRAVITTPSLCRVQDYRALQLAASTLLKHGEDESAKEVMLKMEDWPALIQVHIDAEAWDRAFMTAKRCPEQEPVVHRAHAEWLITHDRCGLVH